MYSALADIWSGEIPERRENAEASGGTAAAVEVVRPQTGGRSYAAAVLVPKFTNGFAGGLTVKLPAKAFSEATLYMLMDCLSA